MQASVKLAILKGIHSLETVNRSNSGLELYIYPCRGKMATSTHNKWEKLQFVTMLARMLKDCVSSS